MRRKNLDLIVALIIAALNVVWALLQMSLPIVRIILALPLVLLLPGYTLTEALFHKRSLNDTERAVLSLGLSLAIDILSGLFLNLLPVGLRAAPWAVLLGLLTLVSSLLAGYLRGGRPVSGGQPLRFRLKTHQGILFGLAISIAILSFVYAGIGVTEQPHPGFTQLWMLPEVQAGKSCAVRLGVRSFESSAVTYHLTVTMNGDQVATPQSFSLGGQGEWDRLVPVAPSTSDQIYVEVRLYRVDKLESVYREVHLTLHNLKENTGADARLCGKPAVSPFSTLASTYSGTIYDVSANLKTSMSLTKIQQSGTIITGYFTAGAGLLRSGSFKGTFDSTKDIRFTVIGDTGHAILLFEGGLQLGDTLSGNYCGLDQKGQCSSHSNYGYGLWSVAPAS